MNTPILSRDALVRAIAKYTDEFYGYYLEWLFEKSIIAFSETQGFMKLNSDVKSLNLKF